LWSIRKKKEGIAGWVVGASLVTAGIERFIAEFWRRSEHVIAGLTTAQLISIALVTVGSWVIYATTQRASAPAENAEIPTSPISRRRKRASR
ncbi:MAG: prolipoprotein diacylglyceryl transferase, partial [Candidatus Poribacteria bacterium]|nr:prolipoprotein diacylglyceryl transferase [Candidatus Poribacteria bacterium]